MEEEPEKDDNVQPDDVQEGDVNDVLDVDGFHDGEDDIVKPANHPSGRSLLTSKATYTGVSLGRPDDVVAGDVIQDAESDVIEYLKDDLEVVDVMKDVVVVVEDLEDDCDIGEVDENEFDVVDVVQDVIGVIELPEDEVVIVDLAQMMQMKQMK